jgi:hypothetical protein
MSQVRSGLRVHAIRQPQKGMTLAIVETRAVTGGVGTHAGTHVAAALDHVGGLLGVREFPAMPAGYTELLDWLAGFGTVPPRKPPRCSVPRRSGLI